jgi:alpha-N-arabinofuranosidase
MMFIRLIALSMVALLFATSCEADGTSRDSGAQSSQGRSATSGLQEERPCPADVTPTIESARKASIGAGKASVEIEVDPTVENGRISPLVFGANHRYPYNGFDMWNSKSEEPFPKFLEMYETAGITALRFPGGRTANNYHWQRAIGPIEDRTSHVDAAFGRITIHGQKLSNEFGPDEFGRFLEESDSGASVVANFATASANEIANWVEYMNTPVGENPRGGVAWSEVRASNGHKAPYGIKYWEIGNELAGEKTFWLGEDADPADRASKYVLGGSSHFERQPAVRFLDYSPSASVSTGKESQVFYVAFPPAKPDSETVYVDGGAWERVDDLSGAGPRDAYEFDPKLGRIRFGDGENGNIPPEGSEITITHVSGPHDGFNDFYREMKEADPSIQVGSGLNSPQFIELMGSGGYPYDFLVAHSYSFFRDTPRGIDELHDLMMYLPENQAGKVTATKEMMEAQPPPRTNDIIVSEWAMATGTNIGLGRIDAPLHYTQSLDSALYTALILREWIKLDIPLASKHTLIDIDPDFPPEGYTKIRTAYQAMIGPYPCFVMSASAHTFRLFTSMTGGQEVASRVINNPTRRIFNGRSLRALETLASMDRDNLYLVVINKERRAIPARVTSGGLSARGPVKVWSIEGTDLAAYNTIQNPNAVGIGETIYEDVADQFTYVFPATSVTSFRLETGG